MSSYNTLVELETLFIEKLQEKYKLNKRDLKKAFSRFDLDNNGLLDLNELCKGFQLLLNGVKETQIQDLVACYDVNGDGKISYEEFLEFLTKRNAIREDAFSDTDSRPSTASSSYYEEPVRQYDNRRRVDERYDEDYDSQASTVYTEESVEPAFHRVRQGYPPQKGYGRQQQYSGRDERRYDNRAAEAERANQRYRDYPQAAAPAGRRAHQSPYAYADSDTGSDVPPPSRGSETSNMDIQNPKELEYRAKVFFVNLKAYLLKKAHDMRLAGKIRTSETMKYSELQETHSRELLNKTFQPFSGYGEGRMRSQYLGVEFNDFSRVLRSFNFPGIAPIRNEVIQFIFNLCNVNEDGAVFRNEEGRLVANHNVFIDLIFGIPVSRKDVKARDIVKVNNGLDLTSQSIDQEHDTGLNVKGFAQKMESGREVVGTGPVRLSNATDAKMEKAMESLTVPLRFISRKSRTALAVPSSFDPLTMIKKSNQLPNYDLVRKHVFGLSTKNYSGNTLFVLPATPSSFSSRHNHSKGMRLTAKQYQQRNSSDYIDGCTLVYASAGLGVVHNLAENTQLYFDDHKDDITCITVSADGSLAATGCMGKDAVVHVWTTDISLRNAKTSIATLGKGFFKRGVCAVEFSYDNVYLICVGCDDQHMMAIFHIATGAKLLEQTTQNGIPPMIKFMNYCPAPQYTEYISREHAGLCDVFATAGDHHVRVWSFRRPSVDGDTTVGNSSLTYKGLTIGKAAISAAKCNLCVGFIYCEDKTYDLVTGGSNGVVYLYRRGVLTVFAQVLRGRIQCLVVTGDRIIVGGAGGKLKILDGRTLSTVQDFSLLGNVTSGSVKPSSSSGSRPKSASRARPSSAGALATARPSTAAPTHAAGGDVRSRRDGGNIISNNADASDAGDEEETSGKKTVTGIAVVRGSGRSAAQGTYVIVALGTGKVVRVDIGSASPVPVTPRPGSSSYREQAAAAPYYGKDLFHFHTGAVYGLATDTTNSRRLIATVCDDRKLMVWDGEDCALLAKAVTQNPSRCCHFDRTSRFVAVGSTNGSITVHFLSGALDAGGNYFRIDEVAYRKDAKAEATVVKFSPSNTMIALGSRDDHIYLYSCNLAVEPVGSGRNIVENGTCVLKAMHRLRGHSATITHLDWSIDSLLLQSTCGAYELLCWDVETGRANTSVNVADVKWKTRTCVLGFAVMGIWPMYADGTDINSVDVNTEKGLVVTANDAGGLVKLFNYPCVVKNAPGKEYTGHSSHVTAVRMMQGGDTVVTTGGNDASVVVWDVVYDQSVDNPDQFR